ncbi:terminase small subunit protein [Sphingobacterium psychroaquaticum]|uniref:terminase small subunit-like protein n=1 Tax=Sphingobacterium psychroaquaticum TaxID=561061 RepID=UPI00106A10B8|nr:terminase small subunit protein [Sphingobacterium psychroaquaticum]QBQ41070.1 terminase small subunit protein [Sphingobacterium psychroaquaticum]
MAGRPETWVEDKKQTAIDTIIQRICEGDSLRSILMYADREVLPSMGVFLKWVGEDQELEKQYARAMSVRAESMFDEIIEISDESNADVDFTEEGKMRIVGEAVQRSRLRVDTRKWALSKMNPKKYGDKVDITSDGEKVVTNIISLGAGVKPQEDE